ncbi:MAG: hypothetical protein LBP34_03315 [Flavobacteriaceae bacterium]|nr:hypothetical protein [Flavobacteriaceae bacterium]
MERKFFQHIWIGTDTIIRLSDVKTHVTNKSTELVSTSDIHFQGKINQEKVGKVIIL